MAGSGGTFYGVLLGGLATLAVVRWQISEGHRSREHQDKVFLTLLVEHVNREISQNVRVLKDLITAFDPVRRGPNRDVGLGGHDLALILAPGT